MVKYHILIICTAEEYQDFLSGQMVYDSWKQQLVRTADCRKVIKDSNLDSWTIRMILSGDYMERFEDYERFMERGCFDAHFSREFTTPSGDHMVAFGVHGSEF